MSAFYKSEGIKTITRNQTAGSDSGHGYGAAAGRSVALGGTLK